jgi:hypothetical protein
MAIDPVWFVVGAYVAGAILVAVILGLYFRK